MDLINVPHGYPSRGNMILNMDRFRNKGNQWMIRHALVNLYCSRPGSAQLCVSDYHS